MSELRDGDEVDVCTKCGTTFFEGLPEDYKGICPDCGGKVTKHQVKIL